MKSPIQTRKLIQISITASVALILSYIESIIPFNLGIPGAKIGLANAISVTALYLFGIKEAIIVSIVRILLSAFMFGSPFSLLYSLCGCVLSLATMILFLRIFRFHTITVSILGGIMHNLGQLAVALVVLETPRLLYYAPMLIIAGLAAGTVIGIASNLLIKKLPRRIYK